MTSYAAQQQARQDLCRQQDAKQNPAPIGKGDGA